MKTSTFKSDISAGIVVFLVALPLCLGISLASGAAPITGIIAGIIGGLVVGSLSGSQVGVSGPAAGLAGIVAVAIQEYGMETFLVIGVLAGVIQLILGLIKAGFIADYFPSSVIKGMLAAIGLTLILKQIPHALGYDVDFEGDFSFSQADGKNTFTEIFSALDNISIGATIITIISVAILLIWKNDFFQKNKILSLIPAPLLVVIMGIVLNYFFINVIPELALSNIPSQGEGHDGVLHVVSMPELNGIDEIFKAIIFPNFNVIFTSDYTLIKGIFGTAFMIAIVASLETLLSVEASDRLDPLRRVTPTNQELIAQGIGNIVSGLLGGLPVTQVIVRSSANVNAGGKTKKSAIVHGVLLLVSVLVLSSVLNLIPLSCLAGLLLVIGYKLASVSLFKEMAKQPFRQSLPFFLTIVIVLFTNLLIGIALGLIVAIFFILQDRRNNEPFEIRITRINDGKIRYQVHLSLHEEVQYLSTNIIKESLQDIPNNCEVVIDASDSRYIAPEVSEAIKSFKDDVAIKKNIIISYQDSQLGGRSFDEEVIDNLGRLSSL
tara:strand:- start:158 stop:1804 length:1647 start_codon:yes stop_codon:yes gene_type:complete